MHDAGIVHDDALIMDGNLKAQDANGVAVPINGERRLTAYASADRRLSLTASNAGGACNPRRRCTPSTRFERGPLSPAAIGLQWAQIHQVRAALTLPHDLISQG